MTHCLDRVSLGVVMSVWQSLVIIGIGLLLGGSGGVIASRRYGVATEWGERTPLSQAWWDWWAYHHGELYLGRRHVPHNRTLERKINVHVRVTGRFLALAGAMFVVGGTTSLIAALS